MQEDKTTHKRKSRLYETKFSFGTTSAIMTTLGLIVGMDHWAHAKASIIGGILVIAVADNISDSLGIHVFQESECLGARDVWISTLTNFIARLLVALSFILPITIFPIQTAVLVSVLWGLFLLTTLTYMIAKDRKANPLWAIIEHLTIAGVVIVLSSLAGNWISRKF